MSREFKTTITARWRWEGMHKWPDAPESVGFLRDLHRHEFHGELELEVHHDDRELEFILVKRFAEALSLRAFGMETMAFSCERMAATILDATLERYGEERWARCTVSEDGENGATAHWNPGRSRRRPAGPAVPDGSQRPIHGRGQGASA